MSKLSIGGMGTVYKAEHTLIGKQAAVKILHPELSGNRDIVQRFFNEAKATTTIKHPGIVEIFDYGIMSSGNAYLTMEFLEGMSLAHRMKLRGRMGEGEAAMLLRGVCSALGAAHAKGIIHRDLKPDNIYLTPDPDSAIGERPKLLDFGIAKLTDIGLAGTATKTGAVMGTPSYMSPEQCRGTGNVDERADLYSIGCIFYELVTGEPPFTNLGAGELIGAHLYLDPEPPTTTNPDLHPDTVALIMALLRKRPDERPQTTKELGQRLTELAQKLGWITVGSPAGVTGPVLTDLALRVLTTTAKDGRPQTTLPPGDSNDVLAARLAATTPPTEGTPVAPSLVSLASGDTRTDKPTTLSGAASQIDLPRRSRKGLGLAMAAAALLAGGGVAFYKLQQKPKQVAAQAAPAAVVDKQPVAPTPAPPAPQPPAPEPNPAPPAPDLEAAKPVDPSEATKPAAPAEPVKLDEPADQTAAATQRKKPRKAVKKSAPKPPPKVETKPVEPKPPATNPLIEREIE